MGRFWTVVNHTAPEVQGDIMTNLVSQVNSMSLKRTSFPFNKTKPATLMFAPFLEAFLTGNRNVRTPRIVGTGRTDHSRIISPRMHENTLRGNDLATTVRSDVGVIEKLDTTVEGLTTNKHRWELPGNYPVFTVVMVIYHYIERIWRILVTPIFNITYMIINIYYLDEPVNIHIQSLINIIQDNNRVITTKKG